jgi:hypothetical protein
MDLLDERIQNPNFVVPTDQVLHHMTADETATASYQDALHNSSYDEMLVVNARTNASQVCSFRT